MVSPGRAASIEVGLVEGPSTRSAKQDCLATGWHLAGQESGEQLFPLSCRAAGRVRDTARLMGSCSCPDADRTAESVG